MDTILGYGLYYPWSLSDASCRHRTRESTPRVHQTRGHAPHGQRDPAWHSPRTLYALRDSGEIEQVGRGLYRLSTAPPLSSPDLVPVAIRIPRAVVCLISALAHHSLTTQVPHSVDLALPSHAQIPKIDGVPLRVFWYSEPSFSAGIETVRMDEVPVRIYSPEKTIADCFKYRNKIGLDLAIEALRAYRDRTPKPNFQALAKFAQINRVQKVMRPYLEAVL